MKKLHLVHLYPEEMNIYGDTGNRLVLQKRLEWRNIPYKTSFVRIGEPIPGDADILLGGGGQDAGQALVEADIVKKAPELQAMAVSGVVMIMICGMYQLLGDAFITSKNETIRGASVLPLFTQAGQERFIGNIVVETPFGELVGYENHSGRTYLEAGCEPLGRVLKGSGNNGEDKQEGVRMHNVFGSYLHGPILSKNPHFADELLKLGIQRQGGDALPPLDDTLEHQAHNIAKTRPR